MMAAAGGESLDRGAKDDEKKKRPEVGDLFIDMQLSTELWHDNICNVDIDLTLTTGSALQTWSIHRSSGRV